MLWLLCLLLLLLLVLLLLLLPLWLLLLLLHLNEECRPQWPSCCFAGLVREWKYQAWRWLSFHSEVYSRRDES